MEMHRILAINPGSTSTKIAVYDNSKIVFLKNIKHTTDELNQFNCITDQFSFRKDIIMNELEAADIFIDRIGAVVGRGGLIKPVKSGVYGINEEMKRDLKDPSLGDHASNLGGLIADDIAKKLPNATAYIVDPVVVDELEDVARITGHPLFTKRSIFHALNQKAVGREHAKSIMRNYEQLNLIVVHMGGGVTIGAHYKGRVIDVNQGLDGDGPFSPERSGSLPIGDLIKLCYSKKYTEKEVQKMVVGEGGLVAYLDTNSAYEVERNAADGDEKSKQIYEAMAYQVAKEIGAMGTVLKGDVDAILITGGVAHSKWFVHDIIDRVHKIAPVYIYPGEDEMKALSMNGLMVLEGEIEVLEYEG